MAKFNTLEDVKKEFLLRSNGGEKLRYHQTRFSDLTNYAPIVERLLDTDYNKVSGFSFSEIMEAVSLVSENYSSADYYKTVEAKTGAKIDESMVKGTTGEDNFWAVNEALDSATTAQAPYPVPSIALTTYQYEKAVLPYLCHQFDLKGNRGLVYYQKITAANAQGNIKEGDLLGSPKEMGAQPLSFVGTKYVVEKMEVGKQHTGGTHEEFDLPGAPIQPGSVRIDLGSTPGFFKDFAQEGNPEEVAMYPIGGNLGTAILNYKTGHVVLDLTVPPAGADEPIYASFARDIEFNQKVDPVTGKIIKPQMARAQVSLESKELIAEDFSVFTETSIYQEALSKAIFGLDWNSQVDEALAALYNKEVANKIVTEIKQEIPGESVAEHDMNKLDGGNNDLFNVQFVAVVMGKLGKMITAASGIGNNKLSAIVINIDVLPIMRALPKFTAANNDFEELMGGMYLAGLYDGMPVIVGYDPIVTSGEIIGIYKGKKDFLTPYVWGTFILPIIRDIYDQDNLAVNRKQLIASAAGRVVAERLASKITLLNIDDVI